MTEHHPIREINEGIEHALHLDAKRKFRIVALVGVIQGVTALLMAFGILGARGDVLERGGESMLQMMNIDPSLVYAQRFLAVLHAVDNEHRLLMMAVGFYAAVRFIEAYGLWLMRNWARWLGLVSAGIYVPFELYYLLVKPSLALASVLSINLIVLWLLWPRSRPTPIVNSMEADSA